MSENQLITNEAISLEVIDNRVYTSSLEIARVFEKRHSDILRTIRELPNDSFNERNFALVQYIDSKGESRPYYNIFTEKLREAQ